MTDSVPSYAACSGGLVVSTNKFAQFNTPGIATRLRNYEVGTGGGYRRINGYTKFGAGDATRPNGDTPVLGVTQYALGIVVSSGTDIFYTEDGITWVQVNKDTTEAGVVQGDLAALGTLTRTGQGKAQFVKAKGTLDHATNPYGLLYIATGPNKLAHFHIDGTGAARTFHYKEISLPVVAELIEQHEQHLIVVDKVNKPNELYYSDLGDFDNFTGGTSGRVRLSDQIVGIKVFRSELYIFCQSSIKKLVNINDPASLDIIDVTNNLGCISGESIQEIAGDLVFLSPDGMRNVAGTARISDVELGSISKNIQPLLRKFMAVIGTYTISSVVLRSKSQYRLFYADQAGVTNGFIGTLRQLEQGGIGFEWSEIRGMNVHSISSTYNDDEEELTYQGSSDGYVYLHDEGNDFDGVAIAAEFKTPDNHFGDLGLRKTLNYLNVSLNTEGLADITLSLSYDFNSSRVKQPGNYRISVLSAPAIIGEVTIGGFKFGATAAPLRRIPVQGSGTSVSYRFYTKDSNAPHTVQGFHTEVMPSGRK
jgi:hypothetical protein